MTRLNKTQAPSKVTLVAVIGMSPAVLTETIWALAHKEENPEIVDEIIIFTTTKGKELLDEMNKAKVFDSLYADLSKLSAKEKYSIKGKIKIEILKSAQGNPLDDIRSAEDNQAICETMLGTLRAHIKENPKKKIVASVAGGRRSMSVIMYSVLSIVGRSIDSICHILTNPDIQLRDFYYPGCKIKSGAVAKKAKNIKLELAEIPFVPLRFLMSPTQEKMGYIDLINSLSSKLLIENMKVELNCKAHTLTVKCESRKYECRLNVKYLIILYVYLYRLKTGKTTCGNPPKLSYGIDLKNYNKDNEIEALFNLAYNKISPYFCDDDFCDEKYIAGTCFGDLREKLKEKKWPKDVVSALLSENNNNASNSGKPVECFASKGFLPQNITILTPPSD